eukprot:10697995-Alexandrium_andersonii.AAC.1
MAKRARAAQVAACEAPTPTGKPRKGGGARASKGPGGGPEGPVGEARRFPIEQRAMALRSENPPGRAATQQSPLSIV